MAENNFPTEVVDLPSGGKLYPKDSPLSDGKIEIKYMTAKEEDILTSQNLIQKGVVIDKLLESLIVTEGIIFDELINGDKDAIMIAARILAYGPDYTVTIPHPETGAEFEYTFNLTECPFKKIPDSVTSNEFEFELPLSKTKIKYKILTGKDEKQIAAELKAYEKIQSDVSPELTTRLKNQIVSVNDSEDKSTISGFVENMLSRDSLALRQEMIKNSPGVDLKQQIELGGKEVTVNIPMTIDFFWPNIGV